VAVDVAVIGAGGIRVYTRRSSGRCVGMMASRGNALDDRRIDRLGGASLDDLELGGMP
jgi:hypothetical protein